MQLPFQFGVSTPTLLSLGLAFAGTCVYFWWMHTRSLTDMSRARCRLALTLRLVLVTCLFLALAGLQWVRRNDSLSVIFLLDASKSLRDDQKQTAQRFVQDAVKSKREGDTVGLLTFGQETEIKATPNAPLDLGRIKHSGGTNATNIAQAMESALSLIPSEAAGKVVVLSDGNENVGSALAAVPALTARGIQVETLTLASSLQKEALVEKVILPSKVKIGEPFTVKVVLNALNAQTGTLTLRRDGTLVGTPKTVSLVPGKRVQEFEVRVDKAGFYRFEATLETDPAQDTLTENNKGLGFVAVRGKPQILYVASTPAPMQFLKSALAQQNIDILYAPPEAMPTTAAAFQPFDSVILSDVPAGKFSPAQLKAMQAATRDFGVGFGMLGGENSFGLGGYRKTPVEEMLPVSLDIRKMQRFPPVTLALVIDRSGSMQEGGGPGGGGPRKIDLAIDAATRAVQALKPEDKVTVITFTGRADVHVPLSSVEQANAIIAKIQQIAPGGGTSIYTGVALGYEQIKNDDSPIKHMIVLTDGVSNDPDYRPLIAEMKAKKITISGVVVGDGLGSTDDSVLRYLAGETGGRYYPVHNAQDIPGIYLQEIEKISSRPIVEEPFTPHPTEGSQERLAGIPVGGLPPLLGYNVTEAKPTADMLLLSHKNEPVYATWRYGLGRVMAWTSDDRNKWAANWVKWSEYGKFWAEAIRWTMRSFTPADYQTQVTMDGTRGHIVVDALDKDGKFVNRLNFTAKVNAPDASGTNVPVPDLPLRQTAPGHYEGWFEAGKIGTYLVNVTREKEDKTLESTVTGLVVPYSPEYKDLTANTLLMAQMAQAGGGETLTRASQVFNGNRPSVYAPRDLTQYLVLLALLLFPVDVAVRRLALEPSDLWRGLRWLGGRLRPVPVARPVRNSPAVAVSGGTTPALSRLRSMKERGQTTESRLSADRQTAAETSAAESALSQPTAAPTAVSPSVPVPTTQATPAPPPPATPPAAPLTPPDTAAGGMSRLIAAKRRAQEQQSAPKDGDA